jgi:NAD(P)-dependent dehydrogenase (short-subunit alcohol dehydrogenase family)
MSLHVLTTTVKGKVACANTYDIDLTGKTVIITGAVSLTREKTQEIIALTSTKNSGIGFEATIKLVANNAKRIILAVRTSTKGEAAKADIEARTGRQGVIEVWQLDMLDYASIQAFADRVRTEVDRLDYAILNAGVMLNSFAKSPYGWEHSLQVNLLSTTLLALFLLPKLKANTLPDFTPVLEIIGSGTHYIPSKMSVPEAEDPSQDPLQVYNIEKNFSGMGGQYAISKLFLMYAYAHLSEMSRSGKNDKTDVYVQVVCPGYTQSGLGSGDASGPLRVVSNAMKATVARPAEKAARTYMAGLTIGEEGHGKFWQYDRIQPAAPLLVDSKAKDRQERVWNGVLTALRGDVPEIDSLVVEASQ